VGGPDGPVRTYFSITYHRSLFERFLGYNKTKLKFMHRCSETEYYTKEVY